MSTEKDHIESIFHRLKGEFDTEVPALQHEERFLEKLSATKQVKARNWWKPLSIAASIAILLSIGTSIFYTHMKTESIEIPAEIENTQFYFTSLLQKEVEKVNALHSPDTEQIISDVMQQLHELEQDYKQLENDFLQNGNSRQILHAMITNFQTRIDLIQDVIQQIDDIKNLKNNKNETLII